MSNTLFILDFITLIIFGEKGHIMRRVGEGITEEADVVVTRVAWLKVRSAWQLY
jgi:hypothetical protein